jgi:hypothetical protein
MRAREFSSPTPTASCFYTLASVVRRYYWICHAYCLMANLSFARRNAEGQSLHRYAPAQRQLHSKFQPPLLEANRALIKETLRDKSVIREPLVQISLSGSLRRSSRSGPFLRIGEVVHILAANKHGQRENFQRLAIVVKPLYPKRRRAALDPNPS